MSIDWNAIDAIIFDLGGVILNLDYHKSVRQLNEILQSEIDYSQHEHAEFFSQFERGEIPPETFRDQLKAISKSDVSDENLDQAWNAMLLDLPPKRLALLQEIRKHKKTYLLSNTNIIHKEAFDDIVSNVAPGKSFQDYLDHCYYSHEIGHRKPEDAAFAYVCENHQLSPERTLFIDDTIGHVKAAREFGLKAHHLECELLDLFKDIPELGKP